jgi:2-succinyl-5-enolpyruvyl-6-hydroxy-3-cyclohexene-1-carboxylate synthase
VHNQPINDIAEICSRKGVANAVMCPGSRCAPLTLAFTRHPKIKCYTFSDERSAGFIAIGMAQQTKKTVGLVCTSGTAAYNFSPAVAEAFFSQTPLLVLTADRPAEWVAQHDGQTIYQAKLYSKHVKQSYTLPQHYDHPDDQWYINRIVNEALNLANQEPKGPVHINIPFREPFYPDVNQPFSYSPEVRIIDEHTGSFLPVEVKDKLAAELAGNKNILVVSGQTDFDQKLASVLQTTADYVPVVTSILSNLHGAKTVISNADAFLNKLPDETIQKLKPDLLLSFGKSVISKNLKFFLRKFRAVPHWHIQPYPTSTDPFQNLSKSIVANPVDFFEFFNNLKLPVSTHYLQRWKQASEHIAAAKTDFFPLPELSELELVNEVLTQLPSACNLHLANSMSVRYAESIGLSLIQKNCKVFSKRGTSGIDGCTSTAVGHHRRPCFFLRPQCILA